MPDDVRIDYVEARLVFGDSPRASAALLRLCVQRLCQQLGLPGKDLDSDIAGLVAQGLPKHVQEALDSVRVIGNNAVHPGELDLRDDPDLARLLFDIVNWIVEAMIQRPHRIGEAYAKLPTGARNAIERRDGRGSAKSG